MWKCTRRYYWTTIYDAYHNMTPNRLLKATSPAFAVTTYTNGGDGLRRSYQKPGQPVRTIVWDGSKYLGEI